MSIKTLLIKNTGFNMVGYLYLLFASFFSISILLKNLGSDLFGVYLFLGSFVPLAAVFDFGISTAAVRAFSLPNIVKEERIKTWKTSFTLYLALALILFSISVCLMFYLINTMSLFININRSMLYWSIVFLSVTVFVNNLNQHFLNLPQAEQRFDIFNSKTLLVGSANTIISAVLSGFYPNLAVIFAIQLTFHILTSLYMIYYTLKLFPGSNFYPAFDGNTARDLLSFGLKNFIGTLASQIQSQIPKFALGTAASAADITAFSIPQNIVAKGAGVVSQFAQAFFPLSASLLIKERIQKLKKLVLVSQAITLLGGLLAIFLTYTVGENFLAWWLHNPEVVSQALPILKVLSFFFVLVALTPVPSALVQGLGKPQVPSFFSVLSLTTDIIFMFIFVPRFHGLGAAYAILASAIITIPPFLVASWVLLNREIRRITI